MDLAVTANKSSLSLATDENGVTFFGDDCYGVLADKAPAVMKSAACDYPQLKGIYSKPKRVIGSEIMSQCNILGIYSPFTFEANINMNAPQYGIPASMCHELSHLRGFMREDEANYLAYYSCVNSGDDRFVYSGAMLGLTYSMSRLAAVNTELYNEVYASLNEHVRADLKYSAQYWSEKDGAASKVSNAVNDVYLKVNNQTDGVQSYGRMVDLMLAEFRHRKNLDITTVN